VTLLRLLAAFLLLAAFAGGCTDAAQPVDEYFGAPGVSDTEIVLGSSLALSGHAGYLGTQTLRGAQACLRAVNESGGIHGRTIRIETRDDAYDPPRCLANTQQFIIGGDIFALFCYVGTPTTVKVLPMLEDGRTPLVGMFTGANALREPFNRYVVNVRASYYQETESAVAHLVNNLGLKRIAVFYQYDAYGFDGLVGTELALKRYELEPVARGSYTRGTLDVEEGLERIAASDAEAVVMVGTYSACAEFIRRSSAQGFDPIFYNVSFVGAEELARRLAPLEGSRVVMSQVVPPLTGQADPGGGEDVVTEYLDALGRYFPGEPPSFAGLEGFLNARILVEGLRRTGPEPTRERFLDAIESIRDLDLGRGTTVTFGPMDHQGMDYVSFTRLEGGRFRPLEDWSVLKERP
jgi:ABC-type branched-subunit amino acid transport system substrate-binding protein